MSAPPSLTLPAHPCLSLNRAVASRHLSRFLRTLPLTERAVASQVCAFFQIVSTYTVTCIGIPWPKVLLTLLNSFDMIFNLDFFN